MGSSFPKYFSAILSVMTNEFGAVSAVSGLPLINGKENMEKKDVSTKKTLFS